MKENITQMRARHEEEVDKLQSECEHEKLSGWMFHEWAPGHSTGRVKICLFCEMVLERKSYQYPPSGNQSNWE